MEELLKPGNIILLLPVLFAGLLFFKIESLIPDADKVRHITRIDTTTRIHTRTDIITPIHTGITSLTTIPMALIGGNRVRGATRRNQKKGWE